MTTPILSSNNRHLLLVLTSECNLECGYCYENNSSQTMSIAIAKKAISQAVSSLKEEQRLIVELFGGEPLMAFNQIREIYDWSVEHLKGMPLHYFMTTNGTLLNDKLKEWFVERKRNITLCLSLDGRKTSQDKNRPGSYSLIEPHFQFFAEHWNQQPVKMTVTIDTVNDLAEDVMFIHSLGMTPDNGFAYDTRWLKTKDWNKILEKHEHNLSTLVDYYLSNQELRKCRMLAHNLAHVGSNITKRWCGAGESLSAIDVDGKEYPCQMFTKMVNLNLPGKNILLQDFTGYTNNTCNECIFNKLCSTCAAFTLDWYKDIDRHIDIFCELQKLNFKATAVLRHYEINRQISTELTEQEIARLESEFAGVKKTMHYFNEK